MIQNLGKTLDPIQLRTQEIAKEEAKRFSKISERIIKILVEENITTKELPRVISAITELINKKIDNIEIEKVLKL